MNSLVIVPGIEEEMHDTYNIPLENIKKAVAIQDFLNRLQKAAKQKDSKKAIDDIKGMYRPTKLNYIDPWDIESLIFMVCEFFARERLLEVITDLITVGIKNDKEDQIASAIYFLRTHFSNEILVFIPELLEYAEKKNSMAVIHELGYWIKEANENIFLSEKRKYAKKIYFLKISVLEKKKEIQSLLNELERFNSHHTDHREEVSVILGILSNMLALEKESELIKLAQYIPKKEFGHTRNEGLALLVLMSIFELIKRHLEKKKK